MSSSGSASISDLIRRAKIQTDHLPIQAMPFIAPTGRIRKTTKTPKLKPSPAQANVPRRTRAGAANAVTTPDSDIPTTHARHNTNPVSPALAEAISALFSPLWGPPETIAGDICWMATNSRPNIIITGGDECTAENIPENNTILIYTNNIDHVATIMRSLVGTPWADDAIQLLPSSRCAVVRHDLVYTMIPVGLFRGGIRWYSKW